MEHALGVYLRVAISATSLYVQDSDTQSLEPVVVVGEVGCTKKSEVPLWLPKVSVVQIVENGSHYGGTSPIIILPEVDH